MTHGPSTCPYLHQIKHVSMSQGIMNIQIGMLDICNLLALPRNEKPKCIAKQSLFAISSNIMGTALLMHNNN